MGMSHLMAVTMALGRFAFVNLADRLGVSDCQVFNVIRINCEKSVVFMLFSFVNFCNFTPSKLSLASKSYG